MAAEPRTLALLFSLLVCLPTAAALLSAPKAAVRVLTLPLPPTVNSQRTSSSSIVRATGSSGLRFYGAPQLSWTDDTNQQTSTSRLGVAGRSIKIIISLCFLVVPLVVKRRLSRIDGLSFVAISLVMNVFDSVKAALKQQLQRAKAFQQSVSKHSLYSSFDSRKFFFKNDNAADRVTLLGVWINVVLSAIKFFGGIAFHSAVLVADAGHSLSDLFSDFVTLWAVQVARLPPDAEHPYGHGKFESVGSLFLALTLLATGLSVGSWSYGKMQAVLASQNLLGGATAGSTAAAGTVAPPGWPALLLAAVSIVSKEWLYQVTKKVGDALGSQILLANAWHHRSDAFSSVLSMASIGVAILFPSLLVFDSLAGILLAGVIATTGLEILSESVRQLTDTHDSDVSTKVKLLVEEKCGDVLGVRKVRSRSVGSKNIVDVTVLTENKISASAAQSIAERVRWIIVTGVPNVLEASVKTQSTETFCPLLARSQRTPADIEASVRAVVDRAAVQGLRGVGRINIHYVNSAMISVELLVDVDEGLSVSGARAVGERVSQALRGGFPDDGLRLLDAEVHLRLQGGAANVLDQIRPSP